MIYNLFLRQELHYEEIMALVTAYFSDQMGSRLGFSKGLVFHRDFGLLAQS